MNVEKTIEFLLEHQARFDANQARFDANQAKLEANFAKAEKRSALAEKQAERRFALAEKRLDRIERGLAQNNRLVARLARTGMTLRSNIQRHERMMREMEDKLNALIDIVDKQIRRDKRIGRNGHQT